jgi:hypothetical protein
MLTRDNVLKECLSGNFLATRPSALSKLPLPHIQILKITFKLDMEWPHAKRTHFILMQFTECLSSFLKDCSKFQKIEVVVVIVCLKQDQRSLEAEAITPGTSVELPACLAEFEMFSIRHGTQLPKNPAVKLRPG